MDARRPCPDSELLAAFLDGTLADYERTAVVTHLTECSQCRAVALAVVEFREVETLGEIWEAPPRSAESARIPTRVARWTAEKTRAPAMALLGCVAVVALGTTLYFINSSRPDSPAVSGLTRAAQGQQLTQARLSDGISFAASLDTSTAASRDNPRLIAAAAEVRESYSSDYGAPARRAVGVAALLVGELDDAVASLAIASLAAPNDARIANDLAAAYYERAQRAGRASDLPAALDAAERALHLQPQMLEALFNRALVMTALRFQSEARSAWQAYLQRDPDSAWSAEARRREKDVAAVSMDVWESISNSLLRSPSAQSAFQAVTVYSSKSRELFEKTLREWTAAARGGRDTPELRATLRVIGQAFREVQREHFYQDVAASVDAAVDAGRASELALAQENWFHAWRLLQQQGEYRQAERALRLVGERLAELESPLALRAKVEQSTAKYFLLEFDDAVRVLPPLRRDALSRDYRVIATRASWLAGLAEFRRNDLASARIAYEEMLESAALPADIDQLVNAHVLLANLHYTLGNNDVAWTHRVEAMALIEQCETFLTKNNAFGSAAMQAAAAGYHATAFVFESSQLQAGPVLEPAAETQALTQRASTLVRLGRTDAARDELRRARERLALVGDSTLSARREADLLAIESELAQPTDAQDALRLAQLATQFASRTRDSYTVSKTQLRLADAALANGSLDRADAAATEAIARINVVRASATQSAALADHERQVYAKAAQIALRRGDLARAFGYMERRRVRTLRDYGASAATVLSLADVQHRLDADTAIAVINQIEDQLHIWIISRDDVAVHSTEMDASRAASLVSSQWQEMARTAEPNVSGELFNTLVRPVWRQLSRAQTIVVVADAPYDQVAYAGLWDGVRRRYLLEDYRLLSASTAGAFVRSKARDANPAVRATNRLAVVNAPGSGTQRSPTGTEMGRELQTLYEASQLRGGASATPSELQNQIGQGDVVHISAPIMAGDANSSISLIVADEPGRKYSGSLLPAQLASMKSIRARLVTLDTTFAGGSDTTRSASVQEVTRALLAAGVPTVVGPIGTLPSADLNRTWIEFYRHYAAGFAAAESLRRAQLAALTASNGRPGLWATLTVFGSNQ